MESFTLLPVTIASIIASVSGSNNVVEESVISTHVSPEIAGLWEVDLSATPDKDLLALIEAKIDTSDKKTPNRVTGVSITNQGQVAGVFPLKDSSDHKEGLMIVEETRIISVPNGANPSYDINGSSAIHIDNPKNTTKNCKERYNFAADNKLLTTSGKEWTYSKYMYQTQEEGLPVIAIKTVFDNNEIDCSGQRIDQTGESTLAFVDYQPQNNLMRWCADQYGKLCFITFHRLLP